MVHKITEVVPNKISTGNNQKFVDSFACTYTVSVIAACNAELFTYPLDLTKTRLQIQGEAASNSNSISKIGTSSTSKLQYRGMLGIAFGIVKEEGPTQLWHGLSSVLCRHIIYSGIRTTLYDFLRQKYSDENINHLPIWKAALFGVLAGSLGQWLATPIDLVKIQMQMDGQRRLMGEPVRIRNMSDGLISIYNRGGIIGLWKGSTPSIQRAALVTLGDISGYDISKRAILNNLNITDGPVVHFMGSICAAFMSTVFSTPADVIKSRIMNQPTDEYGRGLLYKGSYDCLKQTVKNEGYFALYKGFVPTFLRCGPWAIVFWLTFEKLRFIIGASSF